jgi:phage N-6-adenine-methyltransferase
VSLAGFRAKNHPQQLFARGPIRSRDERGTPPELFASLHRRFRFTIDAAALPYNAKLERFWTPDDDALEQDWTGERVWCNPPYSDISPWVRKATLGGADLAVLLLPANRTEQRWWQLYVEPTRDGKGPGPSVEFMAGRLRFLAPGAQSIGADERPPFGCCLVIWGNE